MRSVSFLLGLLALYAVSASVFAFRQTPALLKADRSFAFAVLAATLVVASIRTVRYHNSVTWKQITPRSAITSVLILAASIVGIWAGSGMQFETFVLFNQAYLQWIPDPIPRQFPVSIGLAIVLSAAVSMLFWGIGVFLFWFLFFRRPVARGVDSDAQKLSSDSNPYRAPQQAS